MTSTGGDLQLFARRTVSLGPVLDDDVATRVAAELMTLDALGDDPIDLWINCSGGTLDAALTVMDVIDLLGVPVHARCLGRADGVSVGVLAVAQRRAVAPHARIRFDVPSTSASGAVSDLVQVAAELARRRFDFCTRVARACGRSAEWVDDAVRDRRALEPVDAVRVGLADEIAVGPTRPGSGAGTY